MRLLLILALFCAAAPRAAENITVAAFGDSLSAGYGLPAGQGFAPALEKEMRALGLPAAVVNAAVSGDTTSDGLVRVDWMLRDKPDIVIVEFGANDMFRGVPPEAAKKNLAAIIERIRKTGARVLLAGMRAPSNYPPQYRGKFARVYESLAEEYEIPLYPFFLEGVALNPQLNLTDGIHPNASGVQIIARNIAPVAVQIAREIQ